jgi:hypothetical protein
MNFRNSYTFSLPNYCKLRFFGANGKQSGHVDGTNGERQLNIKAQIRY